ncbi:MAG: addiction module toxin RelE [Actinobacteria bacterium]|nr:addiction module toxin RelE [Actinomycetota bacterium]
MARALRIEFPGALHHAYARGVAKQAIYQSDEDRTTFLAILGTTVERYNWVLHAYCLMGNHYHLLVETPDANLSAGMHYLNGVYAMRYNRAHERVGHLFQGCYGATLVDREEYFLQAACYIVLNPVRAGIVERPSQYPWSSYLGTAEDTGAPRFLSTDDILLCFASNRMAARMLYRKFVEAGIDEETARRLESGEVCGGEEFCARLRELIGGKRDIREIPRRQRFAGRPPIEGIFEGWRDLADRDERIFRAVREYGYSQSAVARHLDLAPPTVSKIVKRAAGDVA